jgi:hypothetical protein
MEKPVCSSVKELIVEYLRSMTDVSHVDDECIVTLPITTFDQRWVDVSVIERSPGYFVVDDSGKAWDELYSQGIAMTDVVESRFAAIAHRFGVEFQKGRLRVGCPQELLQHSIWSVGQCSALAMNELIGHKPITEKDTKKAIGGIISDWGLTAGFRVQLDRRVTGKTYQHTFDFVAADDSNIIAVNILAPGSGALARAKSYGFQNLDLANAPEGKWKKMAILSRPDEWTFDARQLVETFANRVVEYHNPQNDREPLSRSLDDLRKAA